MNNEEFYFESWTPQELFIYLLDIKEIPPRANFENWRYLKDEMIKMCKEYQNDKRRTKD